MIGGFNSYSYIFIFLPLILIGYFQIHKYFGQQIAKLFLIASSIFFISTFNFITPIILIVSIITNFCLSKGMLAFPVYKKRFLFFGVILNLLPLAFFKYFNGLMNGFNLIAGTNYPIWQVIFPVALSFIAFTQLLFLMDCYLKKAEQVDFTDYVLHITFFSKLIAGPLTSYKLFSDQFKIPLNHKPNYNHIAEGLFLFSLGLFKKLLLADTFMGVAQAGFNCHSLNFVQAWVVSLSNTFYIYYDISGYTDMAIGAALLFNIRLPKNFDNPYTASNIKDFWLGFHQTLTDFFSRFIFNPIAKNTDNIWKLIMGSFLSFLLFGLWHGGSAHFIVWGLLQGLGFMAFYLFRKTGLPMPNWLAWVITMGFVNISWLFFSAENIADAIMVFKGMHSIKSLFVYYNEGYILWGVGANYLLVIVLLVCFISMFLSNKLNIYLFKPNGIRLVIAMLMILTSLLFMHNSPFIYYGF